MSTLSTLPQRFSSRGEAKLFSRREGEPPCCLPPAAQISPAIGELALAYIRFGIRPAR